MNREQIPSFAESHEHVTQLVTGNFKKAIEAHIDLTAEERQALDQNFWPAFRYVLDKYEEIEPGITEKIFLAAEAQQARNQEHFDNVTLPRAKRRAFLRGLFGLPLDVDH